SKNKKKGGRLQGARSRLSAYDRGASAGETFYREYVSDCGFSEWRTRHGVRWLALGAEIASLVTSRKRNRSGGASSAAGKFGKLKIWDAKRRNVLAPLFPSRG
ncbi:hypothetical protein, partial [Senegalimassilia anaerobia]|uniref:hypothetical protein n=1 Tax=Senegalimassilia anaerobia TaxID=1473216 RepID=UPI003AF0F49A